MGNVVFYLYCKMTDGSVRFTVKLDFFVCVRRYPWYVYYVALAEFLIQGVPGNLLVVLVTDILYKYIYIYTYYTYIHTTYIHVQQYQLGITYY